jgi:site-specific DNA-methyltransferase (adenine-specific)
MVTILTGDCREVLKTLPDASVNCCITSPPYWGLRDYGVPGIGLEETPEEWLEQLVAVFREVRRVLTDDGTLWVNMGDAYDSGTRATRCPSAKAGKHGYWTNPLINMRTQTGLGAKQLLGMPWRVAFSLQADGWLLRADIIWHKPNTMPESVKDRPTKAHEYIFLLAKQARYFYDADAIKEPVTGTAHARGDGVNPKARWKTPDGWDTSTGDGGHGSFHKNGREKGKTPGRNSRIHQDRDPKHPSARKPRQNESFSAAVRGLVDVRNKRTVWTVATAPYKDAHFATFPPALITPCILAGCPLGGTVLDPFGGSGTTGEVAEANGRNSVLIELNPAYVELAKRRTEQGGLFCSPNDAAHPRAAKENANA